MDNTANIEQLNKIIEEIDKLKKLAGPKSNEFIKWMRDAKQYIEKFCGTDCEYLRDFKKINYYPTKMVLFGGDSMSKEAYSNGLSEAKEVLLSVKKDLENPSDQKKPAASETPKTPAAPPVDKAAENKIESKPAPAVIVMPPPQKQEHEVKTVDAEQSKKQTKPENDDSSEYPEFNGASVDHSEDVIIVKKRASLPQEEEEIEVSVIKDDILEKKKSQPAAKKDDYHEIEIVKKVIPAKKVLLLCKHEEALTGILERFISKLGYEVVLHDTEMTFNSSLKDTAVSNTAYAIVCWKAESVCDGKNIPNLQTLIATSYLSAKLSPKKVLVLYWPDIDPEESDFAGFNLSPMDKEPQLMDLKIAREMDAAGLNIDFNVFKKL